MLIATELIDDIGRLDDTLKASKKRVADAVTASGSTLVDIAGVGPICAAMIIGYTGYTGYTGDIGRSPDPWPLRDLRATAPSEASSGPKARHRLNPRGGEGHARAGTRSKFGPATFGPRWFFSWGA